MTRAATIRIKHRFMGKPEEERIMHAMAFPFLDVIHDPHCIHLVSLADVCEDCVKELATR